MPTLTTPRGTKFRSESRRRFILMREGEGYTGRAATMNRPIILQRSDNLETLRTVVRRQGMEDATRYGATVDYVFIIDSRTGEALPLRKPAASRAARS
jgi:hypothetical protein